MNQDRSTTITNSQLKEVYKQTEVGIIPEDWKVKKLKHVSPSQSVGLVINPSSYFDNRGTIPMLVGSHINENGIDWESANRISEFSNNLLPSSRLAAGDLVTVRVGDPGLTAVVPSELDGCNCASMMIIRQHRSFVSRWLCYVMNSRFGRSQIEHVQYGTAQKQFNISDAVDFLYPVPPLPEQEAIACTLSDIDALIESLDRLLTKKRQIKQGAMQELLRSKDGWEKKRIGDVLTISHGRSQHEVVDENGDYPILASGGQIGRATTYLYNKPSVLIGRKGTIDKPQYMDRPFWTVDTLFYSVIHEPNNAKYLFYQFCLIPWREYNEASGVPSLNARTIESIEITLPSSKEQIEIANILSDMDAEIGSISAKLTKTCQLKQGMMHELLTGRIRLVDSTQ